MFERTKTIDAYLIIDAGPVDLDQLGERELGDMR
jgi:hypothetical protein